ncbi:MAG: ABC transporter permease [Lachnospiraceae bacterium]|nr:ABC transporter permease [Lachnospiraceae bacterium]MDE6252792.1 ABC transporter permease [Lachnospiraceae bacterium]
MLENIRLSFQGIWSHKLRSILTMLGIIIGIAAIITIVSTIKGTNEQIKENLIGSGNNNVTVSVYRDGYEYEFNNYEGIPDGIDPISDELFEEICKTKNVKSASLFNKRSDWGESVYYNSTSLSSSYIYGIDSNYLSTCGYTVYKGRGFHQSDFDKYRKVVLIDEHTQESLFSGIDPIDKVIDINGEPFTVIGIIKKMDEFKPTINSVEDYYSYMDDSGCSLYIPSVDWPSVYSFDEPQFVVVKAANTDSMNSVGKEIASLINSNVVTSQTCKYKSNNAMKELESLQEISNSTNTQLIWIASISLLVGGIGVMNIMLVSVTERTREIGLKKAIGARKNKILFQFLTESMVLTSLGGILGVLCGIGLSRVVSSIANIPVAISIPAAIIAVVFSMVIGIIFGLIPSIQAANLDPIDALRYE